MNRLAEGLLVVSLDAKLRERLAYAVAACGRRVDAVATVDAAVQRLEKDSYPFVLVEDRLEEDLEARRPERAKDAQFVRFLRDEAKKRDALVERVKALFEEAGGDAEDGAPFPTGPE